MLTDSDALLTETAEPRPIEGFAPRTLAAFAGPRDKIYPIAKITTILEQLRDEGVPVERALRGTGIAESAIYSTKSRVSLSQVVECYRNALRLSGDPQFAYHAGQRFHVSTYGMYGFAMLSSTDFRQTMRFAMAYHQLATPLADDCFIEENGSGIWTTTPLAHPLVDADLYRYIVELQCGIKISLHRDIMGPSFTPREIHFNFRPPGKPEDYSKVFECPVLFGQPKNQIVFDAAWLDRPASLGNQITYETVVKLCDTLLEELELRAGVAGKVRHALLVRLPSPASLDDIAEALSISPRTLRRRLAAENTSYRKLEGELLVEMSIKYLRETDLTIDEIATALGFTETGNFRRAFHRWSKASPKTFRDIRLAHLAGGDALGYL